ncbi:MAG: carbohydrate-binding protein [Clostridiales bacterium]|nr:carbohydrate-binding protein [Clostridiales bacterium]
MRRNMLLLGLAAVLTLGMSLTVSAEETSGEISPYRACEHTNSYQLQDDSYEATDTEGGYRHYVCSECGAEYSYETDPLVYTVNPVTGEEVDQSGASNPLFENWEYVPDGEPHVFWSRDDEEWRVYIYGSHDANGTSMCDTDQVLWSAPVYDLSDWRYEGVIFELEEDSTYGGTMLFAPDADYDVTTDTYYMVSSQVFDNSVLRAADSPLGPWDESEGLLVIPTKNSYDPSLYIEDGTIYMAVSTMTSGYSDNEEIQAMVDEDNYTTGMRHVAAIYQLEGNADDGYEIAATTWCPTDERGYLPIYEGPSLTGYVEELDAYVLLYVSYEVGADGSFYNSTISYVYTDDLMNGTWHYGSNGVEGDIVEYDTSALISGDHGNVISDTSGRYVRNLETGEMEFTDFATYIIGNNHGGMAKVNGEWYFFGHRQTNASSASRQAIAGQLTLYMDEETSEPVIEPMEFTSSGISDSLDSYTIWDANVTTYLLEAIDHPAPSVEANNVHSDCLENGPYIKAGRDTEAVHTTYVANLKNGNIVGYKYLDFGDASENTLKVLVAQNTGDADGTAEIYIDAPSGEDGGTKIGELSITAEAIESAEEKEDGSDGTSWSWLSCDTDEISGVHAVYFVFSSDSDDEICIMDQFGFEAK